MFSYGLLLRYYGVFFFFNDTATTEIYTLSLHDALPILLDPGDEVAELGLRVDVTPLLRLAHDRAEEGDRKSTRLNSSHSQISYAVFCLKKKKRNRSTLGGSNRKHSTTRTRSSYLVISIS